MAQRDFKIFVDFDGTITHEDVGDSMFRHFGDREQVDRIINDLITDKISAKECWIDLCRLTNNISRTELEKFIDSMEIDKTFHSFTEFCKAGSIPLFVLSDGFDLYIDRIFKREGLHLKYFANSLKVTDEGKLIPSFPYWKSHCRNSANCKRDHILNNSSDDDITVFIGDGHSDKETAPFCDYIFAKDALLKYCEKERISFYPFNDFNDITKRLKVLLAKKNPAKRHQAELKRKEAYRLE
jgi:2-hydroxy-3-keto-5-methylthiopentenyl-1-phosphate phosphatase